MPNSVSVTENSITDFTSMLPDYKTVLRAPFREWAKMALPGEYDKLDPSSQPVAKTISQSIQTDPPILNM
jgi:hypothetical protein